MEVKISSEHVRRTPSSTSVSAPAAGPSTNSDLDEYPVLDVVFEFFSDSPQKMAPARSDLASSFNGSINSNCALSPAAAISTGSGVMSSSTHLQAPTDDQPCTSQYFPVDPYWESIRLMQQSKLFLEGMLLRSVDYKRKSLLLTYLKCLQLNNTTQ